MLTVEEVAVVISSTMLAAGADEVSGEDGGVLRVTFPDEGYEITIRALEENGA